MADPVGQLQAALAGRYAVGRELGRGGMAHVYQARDLQHDRDVAIKVLRPELVSSTAAERFLREVRIEARLQHPHILPLHDSGRAGGLLYYVMPYVEGETLRDRLARERQLPLETALRITREVADALTHAHRAGVVHRDIKPGNILLAGDHAIVADFGIARAVAAAADDQITESGLAIGTPEYMSPEQASGDAAAADPRADIYALGCVLYEMLAGEPPFHGRTAQVVLARHRTDPPPSLRVVRPNLPPQVQAAIETALAKVPADRFPTVDRFMAALDAPAAQGRAPRPARRLVWVGAAALGAGALGLVLARSPPAALDPNRVIVFPLRESGLGEAERGAGENVATLIGYALDGTEPLKWLEGWDFLDSAQRADPDRLTPLVAREISRAKSAGYYIDGTIVGGPDSATVVLRLHDVAGDSIARRAGAAAPSGAAALPQLGVRAVGDLLPALLAPGRQVDLSALSERKPSAIANFLQGEREYRRMHFGRALEHYREAVREDSALALAAVKGAAAANWPQVSTEDEELIGVALQRGAFLPPRQLLLARGLQAYYAGAADSAVRWLGRAVRLDPAWADAWMALGEVYFHLLPDTEPLDSLAQAAFERASRADTTFTPPLLHLAEIALWHGDLESAERLVAGVREAEPDGAYINQLDLMLQCARQGPRRVDWAAALRRNESDVVAAGKLLAVGASWPACAAAAFGAILAADSAGPGNRWAALQGLQNLLVATGRADRVPALLGSPPAAGLPAHQLVLLQAVAGEGLAQQADTIVRQMGQEYAAMSAPWLWLLASWESGQGDAARVEAIAAALRAKHDSSGSRRDSLLGAAVAARLALLRGDSDQAVLRLQALHPDAPSRELEWQPWESLGMESLVLADLLLARRQYAEAYRVAARFDSPQPLVYLLCLRRSLAIRVKAAKAMGDADGSARARTRLERLERLSSFPIAWSTTKAKGGAL
jgi:serine/threonine-protein kinase